MNKSIQNNQHYFKISQENIEPSLDNFYIFDKKILAIYSTVPAETRINHYETVQGLQVKSSCSPCYKLSAECLHKDKCLNTVTVNEVFTKIVSMLEVK